MYSVPVVSVTYQQLCVSQAERYVLGVVKKIKSRSVWLSCLEIKCEASLSSSSIISELEEALLVMPLSEMVDFLPLIDTWIQV